MNSQRHISRHGTILIMALWTLGFLSVFAVTIGMHVRHKISTLSRLEKRSELQAIAESGVRAAKAVFDSRHLGQGLPVSGMHKQAWFNDSLLFRSQQVGSGSFEIGYNEYIMNPREPIRQYGLSDEERRINVNKADRYTLKRLIDLVSPLDSREADELARAIISWREYGDTDIVGFYSDAFYENLEYPYPPKKEPFETLDELRLVQGVDTDLYERLIDFVTVYGTGKVNINTASGPVLIALGISPAAVEQILVVRRGPDGLDDTVDDYMFTIDHERFMLILPPQLELKRDQFALIQQLLKQKLLGISSSYFRIESTGRLKNSPETMTITCVFKGKSGRMFYWNEKRARP